MFQPIEFNGRAVRAGDCIGDGMNLIQSKYWLFLGMSLLGMVIGGCIPCVSIFLAGPIAVGIFYSLFVQMRAAEGRGAPVKFGMLFKGFERFVPAMVVGIIQAAPQVLGEGLRLTGNFANILTGVGGSQNGYGGQYEFAASDAPNFALTGGIILLILIVAAVVIVLSFAWGVTFFFALPLIADRNLDIGAALKLSARAGWANWSGLLVLFIFQFLVGLAGVLLLCVGVFFVMPIIHASNAVAFRQVFPETPQEFGSNEPPRPDAYGGGYGTAK